MLESGKIRVSISLLFITEIPVVIFGLLAKLLEVTKLESEPTLSFGSKAGRSGFVNPTICSRLLFPLS